MPINDIPPEEARRRISEIDNRIRDLKSYLNSSGRIAGSTNLNIQRIMKEALAQRKRLKTYLIGISPINLKR